MSPGNRKTKATCHLSNFVPSMSDRWGYLQFSPHTAFFYLYLRNVSQLSEEIDHEKQHRLFHSYTDCLTVKRHQQTLLWCCEHTVKATYKTTCRVNPDTLCNCASQANIEGKIYEATAVISNWAPVHGARQPFRDPPTLSLSLCAPRLDGE